MTPRLARNALYAGLGLVGGSALGLLVSAILARLLGVQGFGIYTFALAYVSLWAVLMEGGSALIATREVARRGSSDLLRALFTLKPALIVIAYAGLFLGAWFGGFSTLALQVALLVGIGGAAHVCMTLSLAVFRGHEEFGTVSACLLVERLLFALLAAGAALAHLGVTGVALAAATASVLTVIGTLALLRRRHGISWTVDPAALRTSRSTVFRSAGPLLLADALTVAHVRNAPIVLELALGTSSVGLYMAARHLVEAAHLFPTAAGTAMFPRLVSGWEESGERGRDQLRLALRFMGTLAAALLVAGWLWAGEAVAWLLGSAYAESVRPLRILLGALGFMMLNAVLSLSLVARGGEGLWAGALALATAVNLLVTALLLPGLGLTAPAWASLVSEAVLFAGCLAALRRASVTGALPPRQWARILVTSGIAFAALWVVKQWSPIVALSLTVVALGAGFELLSPIRARDLVSELSTRRGSA